MSREEDMDWNSTPHHCCNCGLKEIDDIVTEFGSFLKHQHQVREEFRTHLMYYFTMFHIKHGMKNYNDE